MSDSPSDLREVWARPVPVIGDTSSAKDRASDPTRWQMSQEVRDALHEVIGARRDIRRYRPDPVPEETLRAVLEAGHLAPSVGHSQPWRFIVVTDPTTRDTAARLADRERLRQANELSADSAARLLDLQLEGIREAPLGIVVVCDRRTPAAGVLGRATFQDADLLSCACAIQNLWLAARAEGLGMGWVTLFEPKELADLIGLPDGVVPLGWLCLGWPDELPPSPGLERAGWSRRMPLEDVVLHERWPASDEQVESGAAGSSTGEHAPAPPPSHLAKANLQAPAGAAIVGPRDERDAMLTTPGALGVLDRAVDRVLSLNHPRAHKVALLIAAADHPVVEHGVSPYKQSVTRDVAEAAVAGRALSTALAHETGMSFTVIDAGIVGDPLTGAVAARPQYPQGDLAQSAALDPRDVDMLMSLGRETALGLGESHGLLALGEIGIGNTTVAAALTCALLGAAPDVVVGLGSGADAAMLERKRSVVAAAVARVGASRDPRMLLSEIGGPELAVLVGAVLGAAEAGMAIVLDGMAVTVAASLAVILEPAVQAHLVAGQRSREQGHALLLTDLGLEPLLDVRIRAGEGAAAVLATGLILTTMRARRGVARTE